MASIEIKIRSNKKARQSSAAKLTFEITNKSSGDIFVLKRHTPLEGLRSDCLIVKFKGKKLPYDGYLLKRDLLTRKDFVLVHTKQTLSVPINAGMAYDVSKAGVYQIKFNRKNLFILPGETKREEFSKKRNITRSFTINNSGHTFRIDKSKSVCTTIGATMRKKNKASLVSREFLEVSALQQPVINGGTPEQKRMVEAAHQRGYEFAITAANEVNDDENYNLWFGAFTSPRSSIVKENYEKIKSKMETAVFTYELESNKCSSNVFAVTSHGSTTICICKRFWKAPTTGLNSQAGTMVHEHSHATASTSDLEDGIDSCQKLARTDPGGATLNADNYEYFSESLPANS